MRYALWSFILFAALSGCGASFTYKSLDDSPHSMKRRDPDSLQMFTSAAPSRPFVEVGELEGKRLQGPGYTSWVDDAKLVRRLRKEAAGRGCEGLVVAGGDTNAMRATCIVFR